MAELPDTPWLPMSVDEYADFQRRVNGQRLRLIDGVWWRAVRPFFWRPLYLFDALSPDVRAPRSAGLLGGAQFPVGPEVRSNSQFQFLMFDNLAGYSLEALKGKVRRDIQRGLGCFRICGISDPEQLARLGHPVYVAFQERTRYRVNRARLDPVHFKRWAEAVMERPHPVVLGAWHGESLAAVSVSFCVRDTLFYSVYFGNRTALDHGGADAMLHTVKVSAAADRRIRFVFAASSGMPRGLDFFYLRRGFRQVNRPALLRGNPITLALLRCLGPTRRRKVFGAAYPARQDRMPSAAAAGSPAQTVRPADWVKS